MILQLLRPRRPVHRVLLFTSPWVAAVFLWLTDALDGPGGGAPPLLDAAIAWTAVAITLAGIALAAARLWSSGRSGRTLLALVALAAVTYFTGLAQEVVGRYFGDEGIYLAQARRINDRGQLLRPWFIYPHLLFFLDAFALWMASALGPVVPFLARTLYGIESQAAIAPLVTRGVTASMGAATVIPVFVTARRIAGTVAAGLAGALIALCPLYIRVAHLNISDVVGAFFATMALMECARLLDGEHRNRYVLAGLWAGLAAGGKYPAGVAAVAVAGVWLGWRLRRRDLRPGLLWAALASIGAFLATTPSLIAYPDAVVTGGGTDVLFGFRQYALSGWSGVVRASNTAFYLDRLLQSFGILALGLGVTGAVWLDRSARRRLLWLAPFPAAYLLLLLAMRIAVERNLLPILPALAVLFGVGLAGWAQAAGRLALRLPARLGGRRAATVLVVVLGLALPAWRTTETVVRFSRPTTRELAEEWIRENLPPGSAFVQEVYTPHVQPEHLYPAARPRFVVRLTPEQLRDPRFDFVFLASDAYARFFHTERLREGYREGGRERYQEIFETFELVAEWEPGRFRAGPTLRLYELDPEPPPWSVRIVRPAEELLTAEPAMRREHDGAVLFRARGQWALAKGYLEPGRYRVTVEGHSLGDGGGVQVLTRTGEEVDLDLLSGGDEAAISLPRRDKYFVYVRLPEGSVLTAVRLERTADQAAADPAATSS